MAGRTNTDRIEDLTKQTVVLTRDVEHLKALLQDRTGALRADLTECRSELQTVATRQEVLLQRVAHLEQTDPPQLAVQAERINHLEKLLDEGRTRRWQVWLAFVGAALSAGIALTVALVRK